MQGNTVLIRNFPKCVEYIYLDCYDYEIKFEATITNPSSFKARYQF